VKIGLIGLNQTGKTSLFELLTGKAASNIGTCFIPDERIDFLSGLFKPKKTIYAKIEVTDVPGFSTSSGGANSAAVRFLDDVRHCDALVHVLRAFESDSVIHDMDSIDPLRDLEAIESEMLFADLEMIEKRINKINSGKKVTKEQAAELDLLKRCFSHLENDGAIRDMELTEDEHLAVRGFSFLTEKPCIVVINLDENQWESGSYQGKDAIIERYTGGGVPYMRYTGGGVPYIELCVAIELEISKLSEEDKGLFIEDLGIAEPGVAKLAKAVYSIMNLISFLTYGEDEVRAWTIEKGTVARVAAGKIHTDIQRGFIRAEVVKYNDLLELGTIIKVKEKGLFRLEGKDYIVADGDIITFRFNV